jgi:outer membrane protein
MEYIGIVFGIFGLVAYVELSSLKKRVAALEKELAGIQQRLEEFNQTIQQELQQQQQQLMAPIYQKAQEAVNTIAKAGGYIYVMDQSSFLYFDPKQSVDITPEARKALNIPAGRTLESLQAELQAAAEAESAAQTK